MANDEDAPAVDDEDAVMAMCAEAGAYFSFLATSTTLSPQEHAAFAKVTTAVAEHLQRQATAQAQTQTAVGKKVSAKDLLGEAERILHKAGSGLSLFDRLRRDEDLREDIAEILREMAGDGAAVTPQWSGPRGGQKKTRQRKDTEMTDVPVQGFTNLALQQRYT